ncbi:MAG TPA: NADH-quinone oxidoreductase subunit C [Candidatus Acidoferrales bacterium]|jgi:Ni,Fe-hydrogenase III large subunit/Ni,Fe-hydrogenase III component G|nr:NADH-quinone oxidoreductase subunit C [Candidatus Acidoferrales bacterium]
MPPTTHFPLFDDLREKFPDLAAALLSVSADQASIALSGPDIRPISTWLESEFGARLAAVFAEDRVAVEGVFYNHYVFECPPDPCYLLFQAPVPAGDPRFPSLAAEHPAVNWQEREIQDWFGLEASGHPNPRRVALHDNWPEVHPLLKDFPLDCVLAPFLGERHVYRPTLGEGVFQIPVGPVHAGIIEPGHFNFAVAGEPILYLQLRMFYTHKGAEKLFEAMPIDRCVFLAESISGDSAFSHGTAFCQAIERAAEIEVPFRAHVIRTVLLELERVYNHIADIGAIAMDVGFMVGNAHAGRLREMVMRLNEGLTGSRLLRGMVCVGGVRRPWSLAQRDLLRDTLLVVEREFNDLVAMIKASDSTRDRLDRTGILRPEIAKALGIVGVGGRASGIDLDVRRDHPYAAYSRYQFRVPVYNAGDVLHRMQVRIDEVAESLDLLRAATADLTVLITDQHGPCCARPRPIPPDCCALSAVEGWRGEILHWVRTAPGNRLERCKIKDPSVNNWPALVEAVQGNIIADFPVINKSFNLSYSGTDR